PNVLNQLDLPHQRLFCPILTYKYACDIRVIHLMRERTLGNSPTRQAKQLKENHGEEWLNRLAHYMEECATFADRPSLFPVTFQEPSKPIEVPTNKWLLSVYGKDIMSRLDHIKASITSKFGNILKMDLTKKIIKKLSGHAKGTAPWLSSVGNKRAEILISVLTDQDPQDVALLRQAKGEQLEEERLPIITDNLVSLRISKKELAMYCRRRTRGVENTVRLIECLL
ncbi:hypothetical protein QTP70_019962, partial [Hemibagrus guttatus]